jgi:hypothetical protein
MDQEEIQSSSDMPRAQSHVCPCISPFLRLYVQQISFIHKTLQFFLEGIPTKKHFSFFHVIYDEIKVPSKNTPFCKLRVLKNFQRSPTLRFLKWISWNIDVNKQQGIYFVR